ANPRARAVALPAVGPTRRSDLRRSRRSAKLGPRMPLRPLLPLLLLLGACSRPDAPASTTSSARAPAPPAPAAAAAKAPVQPAGSALAKPPAPKPARALEPDATAPLRLPGRGEPAALAKRVLHVGDSMVPLVGNYLRPVFEKRGASYAMVSTHSSSTRTWAADDKLDAALKEHAPELVLISLGSNELFDKDLAAIGDAVRAIVERRRSRLLVDRAAGLGQGLRVRR